MKYCLKQGAANDFSAFSENLVPPHAYFVPFSSKAVFRDGEGPKKRLFSDRVQSLAGEWDFCFFPNGYYERDFDSARCVDRVPVPAPLESLGYFVPGSGEIDYAHPKNELPDGKKSFNSAYVYRTTFSVPDPTKKYSVTFTEVGGRFEVYLNGIYCGFSALGSGEFSLSPYLVYGENELLVVLKRFSPCAFFSRRATAGPGILGDVYLTITNANALFDYSLYCKEDDGVFNGSFTFLFSSDNSGARAEINLSRRGQEAFSFRVDVTGSPVEYEFSQPFMPYTAESPNLYDLCVRIIEQGKVTEYVNTKVGFTSLDEYGGTVTLCSRPLKIRAAEYNPVTNEEGKGLTFADYRKDFALLKDYGFNAVSIRRSDPTICEAARDIGLYVIVGMGIDTLGEETFGSKKKDCISDDKRFAPAYLEKTARLYHLTRNNSAVLFYDYGEESADAYCVAKCLDYVFNKGQKFALANGGELIVKLIEPTMERLVDEINRYGSPKPIFLSNYATSSGLGSGYLSDFDSIVENTPCCFGGCVGRFCDDTIDEICVCDDGLFSSDRRPYPSAELHRHLARPIKVRSVGSDVLEITNVSFFSGTDHKSLRLTLFAEGKVVKKFVIPLSLPPRTAREYPFPVDKSGGERLLNCALIEGEKVISEEQIVLGSGVRSFSSARGNRLFVTERDDLVEISFDSGRATFSRTRGALTSYSILDKEVLRTPVEKRTGGCADVKINRPFVRNVLNGKYAQTVCVAQKFSYAFEDNAVVVTIVSKLFVDSRYAFSVEDVYTVYPSGVIEVTSKLTPQKRCPDTIDCFAKSLRFARAFDRVTYYGRGPLDNYVDLNAHAFFGVYDTTAEEMSSGTPYGAERGNRTEVRYAVLRDGEGLGLLIESNEPFQLRVSASSDEELAIGYLTRTEPVRSGVYVDVAAKVSGYGSGVAEPLPKYRVKSGEHTLSFRLLPLKSSKKV